MAQLEFGFYRWEKETPNEVCLRQPFGDRWEEMTWAEVGQQARKLATGLQSMGLAPGAHIGLISKNCREWIIADLAIIMAGYVSVPLYPSLKANSVRELIGLGDIEGLFLGKIEDWEGMEAGIPKDLPMIRFPHYEGNGKIEGGHEWQSFINRFGPIQGERKLDANAVWTIIFTSGTTGTPKGVVHTFGTLAATAVVVEKQNSVNIDQNGNNRFFSFLPLNHIAERVLVEQNLINYGGSLSFAESLERFAQNLQSVQPTFFFAVPRIWTKFQLGVLSKMPQKKLNLFLKIPFLSSMVKKKIQKGLGMSNVRGTLTGAAAIPESLKEWYRKLDIPMVEGYGMTENCAVNTSLLSHLRRPGSVGQALPDSEIKIDPDTGEIMMRAPWVMKGYYKSPEKTAEVLDNGWLRTGDQGRLDEEGFLYITGRVKDSFKTSKGKYILPGPIEREFESCDDIEQICLCGLSCPQPVALIVPSEIGKAKSKEELNKILIAILNSVNEKLPAYQKVSTLVVVKEIWDVGNELLTPTLKIKRNKIHDRYGSSLLDWHKEDQHIVWE